MIGGLTKSETATVLQGLTRSGRLTRETYEAVMGWAEAAALDRDLLDLVLQRYLVVEVNGEGELQFVPTELGMASSRKYELERMKV